MKEPVETFFVKDGLLNGVKNKTAYGFNVPLPDGWYYLPPDTRLPSSAGIACVGPYVTKVEAMRAWLKASPN